MKQTIATRERALRLRWSGFGGLCICTYIVPSHVEHGTLIKYFFLMYKLVIYFYHQSGDPLRCAVLINIVT